MTVIGPIDETSWKTMLMLRKSLDYMKENNVNDRFSKCIEKEKDLYKTMKQEYIQ